MKNFREYYTECFEAEKPKFIRVLKEAKVPSIYGPSADDPGM
jgi:hypothetical protein